MGFNSGSGSGGGSVAGSSDVALSNPANNNVLTYDTTTSKWKNAVAPAATVKPLVWNGSAYPTRTAGITNIFVGAQDPGLAMNATSDVWAAPTTTLDSVVAAMQDTSSDLFAATMTAAAANRIRLDLSPLSGSSITRVAIGDSPNRLAGWELQDSLSSVLFAQQPVPMTWNTARVRIRWTRTAGTNNTNARLFCDIAPYTATAGATNGVQSQTSSSIPGVKLLKSDAFSSSAALTPGEGISVFLGRLGAAGSDTFDDSIYIVDAWLEKLS